MTTTGRAAAGAGTRMVLLLAMMAVGDSRQAGMDQSPVSTLAPMPMAVEEMPAPAAARALAISLQADLDASMFQGTVQAVNAFDSSLVIRTDFGRTVVLFAQDCYMAAGLKAGDRVRLEPDAAGSLTVTPLDRRPSGRSADVSQPVAQHLAWSPSQCQGGTI
jgi:hypothetical protein